MNVCVFLFLLVLHEGGMWDLIALIPDHCLSIHFTTFGLRRKKIVNDQEEMPSVTTSHPQNQKGKKQHTN